MPSRQQHLAKSRSNEALSLALQSGSYPDWAVTTMFYAALHLVEAYLAGFSIHPQSHSERRNVIQRLQHLRFVWSRYDDLYNRSTEARYNCAIVASADVEVLRQTTFEPLKQYVRRLLGI